MIRQGPFALTLSTPLSLPLPTGRELSLAIINNQSTFTCSVDINGPQEWLQPFESHIYVLDRATTVAVTPLVSSLQGNTGASASLFVTWVDAIDTLNGTYPVALSGVALAQAQATSSILASTGVPINTFTTSASWPSQGFYAMGNANSLDIAFYNYDAFGGANRTGITIRWSDGLAPNGVGLINEGPYIVGGGRALRFRTPIKGAYAQIILTSNGTLNSYRLAAHTTPVQVATPVCSFMESEPLAGANVMTNLLMTNGGTLYGPTGVSIGASATVNFFINAYFGLAQLWTNVPAASNVTFRLTTTELAGQVDFVAQQTYTAPASPNNDLSRLIYLPAGDNVLTVLNLDASARVCFASLTPASA